MTTPKKRRTLQPLEKMGFHKKLKCCEELDVYLKARNTGTLEELAEKCAFEVTLTANLLAYMIEELNCPIEYSHEIKTYYYKGSGSLLIGFHPTDERD